MVDLLREALPGRPGRRQGPARRGREAGRTASRRLPARAGVLLAAALVLLAAGCASGRGDGPAGGDDEGPAADSAAVDSVVAEEASAARRAASNRLVARGRRALADGRPPRASEILERAIRVDPSNGSAYLALAEVRWSQGRVAEARGLLERASGLLEPGGPAAGRADSLREELEDGPG